MAVDVDELIAALDAPGPLVEHPAVQQLLRERAERQHRQHLRLVPDLELEPEEGPRDER
jgi:hypothetical protein